MPKRERAKSNRTRRTRLRSDMTDEKGIRLTSDRPPIIPSSLADAMRPPAGAPTKATRKMDPEIPTTVIPELNSIELTPFAYECVVAAIMAADKVQIEKMNPKGGPNLRYRIELAAAFLAHVMHHASDAATTNNDDVADVVNLALNLAVRRAQEIYGQDSA